MRTGSLRDVQQPLKQRYRQEASAAMVTLRASGDLGEGLSCSVETGRGLLRAGLHPATGGDPGAACSGDMLLQALVACAGVTMQAVAASLRIAVAGSVHAEGDLDVRGTLAVDKEVPVGIQRIRLRFDLTTEATDDEVATLLRLTERYCVILQTLAHPPALEISATSSAQGASGDRTG